MSQPTHRLLEAVTAVVEAIDNAGPHPEFHKRVMDTHQRQWPYLWEKLDELLLADEEMRR